MLDRPRTPKEWLAHLRGQLNGETEAVIDDTEPDDCDMNPPRDNVVPLRKDWE